MSADAPEQYIPSTPETRARNEAILAETARRLNAFACAGCGTRHTTALHVAACCDIEPTIIRSYD